MKRTIRRTILLAVFGSVSLLAQIQTINNEAMSTARVKINANFAYLNSAITGKAGVSACATNQFAIQTTTSGVVCIALTSLHITTALGFTPSVLPSGTGVVKVTSGSPGVVTGTSTDCVKVDGSSGGCGSATSGSTGQALTSNGSGGFGTPVTLAPSATTDATNATNITSGRMGIARVASGTPDGTKFVRDDGALAVPTSTIGSGSGTGIWCFQGGTSGQICVSVGMVSGTSVAYLYPSIAPTSGQYLSYSATVTCPSDWGTPPAGTTWPTTCYQMAWATPSGGGGGLQWRRSRDWWGNGSPGEPRVSE